MCRSIFTLKQIGEREREEVEDVFRKGKTAVVCENGVGVGIQEKEMVWRGVAVLLNGV